MNALARYDRAGGTVVPRETVRRACFVRTPKELLLSLMAGERVCFKRYNKAAKYYLRAVEIFRMLYREGMSDYEFVVELNNYIVSKIEYDHSVVRKRWFSLEDLESYEIDAPLFKNKGVCSGKSKFFSLMCALANIKTVLVTGTMVGLPDDLRHAWNKVFLKKPGCTEAQWWNIDTTNNLIHTPYNDIDRGDFFLVNDQRIMRTHTFIEFEETFEYQQLNYAVTGSLKFPRSL